MERHHFEDELKTLKNRLITMGGLVEERLHKAMASLIQGREDLAQRVIREDDQIDAFEIEIDDRCLKLLALQQPLASDLRLITSAMKICSEIERVGDKAASIARCSLTLIPQPPLKPLIDIPRMADMAQTLIHDALDAFVNRDAELARSILVRDRQVDELKDQLFRELLTYMMADPATIQRALQLIMISRHIERVADHATNIAEDVIFLVEATDVRHRGPSGGGDQ
jgi:phosphate transport system protein